MKATSVDHRTGQSLPIRAWLSPSNPETESRRTHDFLRLEEALKKLKAEERGWGKGRVARDFYDPWYLLKNQDFPAVELTKLTREKAAHRNVQANEAGDFFRPSLLEIAKRQWAKQLRIFVPAAPDANSVLGETRSLVEDLWQR